MEEHEVGNTDSHFKNSCDVDTKISTSVFTVSEEKNEQTGLLSSVQKHGLSWQVACFFVIGEILGGGVVAIPDALANTGWAAGISLMIINVFANSYLATIQSHCLIITLKKDPEFSKRTRDPFTSMINFAYGRKMKILVRILLYFLTISVTTVYLLIASQLTITFLTELIPSLRTVLTVRIWLTVFAFIIIPLTFFGTPKDFWGIAMMASLTTIVAIFLVLIQLWLHVPNIKTVPTRTVTVSSFFFGSGTIIFGFAGLPYLPNIHVDMKKLTDFPKVIYVTFSFISFIYCTVAFTGMAILGDNVQGNIVLNTIELTKHEVGTMKVIYQTLSYSALLLFTGHFISAYVLIFNNIAQDIEEYFSISRRFNWRRCIVRSSLVILTLILGQTIPNFNIILSFAGGILFTTLSYHIVILIYFKLEENISMFNKIILLVLFVYGSIIVCGTLYSNVESVILLYKHY